MLITKYISLFFLAATKFLAASLVLLADNSSSVFYTFLVLFLGGNIGVIIFYIFGKLINREINSMLLRWKKNDIPTKKITKNNRKLIVLKNKYGLIGISILTPLILSIPLGCFLASRFYAKESNTIIFLLMSVVGWTGVVTIIKVILILL